MAAKKVTKETTAKKESPVKKAVKTAAKTTVAKKATKAAASTAKTAVVATAVKKTADKEKKPATSNAQVDKLKAENIALKARVKELEKILKDTVKNINKAL